MLATTRHGADTGTPLLIVHGLFGSARNWGVIAKRLSETRPVLAVDMRNHGQSPWADHHDYPALADDLAEVIEANGGAADVLGHSMGGKAAMVLALTRPDLVNRLIVADVAPVGYAHSQNHLVQAMQALDLSKVRLRSEADAQLADEIPEQGVRAFLLQSLDLKEDPPSWRLNLEVLRAEMPKIVGWPEIGGSFEGPTFFVSGAESDYVLPEYRDAIRSLFPHARFAKIPKTGHWLHAERPREFEALVGGWLDT